MEKVFWSHVMNLVKLRRYIRKQGIFRVASVAALFAVTGCGAHIKIGTPEAVRSLGDWDNGHITNSKASADATSAYWASRNKREEQETFRGGTEK